MDFTVILDISSVIWSEEDFQNNTDKYYELIYNLSDLLERIEKEKSQLLLRNELLDEIIDGFPFDKFEINKQFSDFGRNVFASLIKFGERMVIYPEQTMPNIESVPNLIKPHYNKNTQNELKILISRIHEKIDINNVYFTFAHLWEGEDKWLATTNEETELFEHETIITDKDSDLETFLKKFTKVFDHNKKHDRVTGHSSHGGDPVFLLSCYDGKNKEVPQALLDAAFIYEEGIYGFDEANDVYVIFRAHRPTLYHAYDEPDRNQIPDKVKKHFNKW